MVRLYAFAALFAVAVGLTASWYFSRPEQFSDCSASSASTEIGGPFTLVNHKGETVTEKEVFTQPSLLYFGYTFCPDVCPFDVARNVEAIDFLTAQGIEAQPVFISIDPRRDTVEIMDEYVAYMHEKMVALTGTEEQVAAASKAYRTYYEPRYDGTEDYIIDHSTFTYLVLPEYGFVEFFKNTVTPEEMAARTACFINNS
jgi:protein SCO1/2